MSSKNNKPKKEIKKDEKISSVIEVKEKDNKLLYVLVIVILILLSLLIYFIFFNKKEDKCDSCCSAPVIEIETDPKYQLINYEGFRFKMPLDWDFVSNDSIYSIVDKEEKLFITLDKEEKDYDSFVSNEYQNIFLENIQTNNNIKIEKSMKESNYYLYEGNFNNYYSLIVAIGNEQKTIIVKAQFIDKVSYDELKNSLIEFATSSIETNES